MPRRRSTPTPTGSLPSVPVRVAGASFLAQTLNRPYDNPKDHSSFNVAREISPKLWKDIWTAGQGVGGVNDIIPVAELCARLQREWRDGIRRLSAAVG